MNIEKTFVHNFEGALRGMRNSHRSWAKADSKFYREVVTQEPEDISYIGMELGPNDLELAQKLVRAGSSHRKFMRQIIVSVDVTAPLYWWKEFDTYKVSTTANSDSTMHNIIDKPFKLHDFEVDDFNGEVKIIKSHGFDLEGDCGIAIYSIWDGLLDSLEELRINYLETQDKKIWKELIRLLPESYLQLRTLTLSYENLINIYNQRKGHKLTEWTNMFLPWVECLPYAEELIMIAKK